MSELLIVLKAVFCLAFLAAGIAKLARAKPLVQQFMNFIFRWRLYTSSGWWKFLEPLCFGSRC